LELTKALMDYSEEQRIGLVLARYFR